MLVLLSCAPERKNIFSKAYHNTTAHYNAYWIANEHLKQIDIRLREMDEPNYFKVLNVYPPIDTVRAKNIEEELDDAIKKASIAIQRHPGSDWEDDSYILVGRARYYWADYANAIETFKYVNVNSDDDDVRHEALIWLMRTFIDYDEFQNAIAVSDYLKREDLNRKNTRNWLMTKAHLHQQRDEMREMVRNLYLAAPYMRRMEGKERYFYILGQAFEELGYEKEALKHYKKAKRVAKDYELAFNAKVNMAKVSPIASKKDLDRIRTFLDKMLKDEKNKEYVDKVYYEKAQVEEKHGDLKDALKYYKLSAQKSTKNTRLKSYAYLRVGEIYYDSLREFENAQLYYDSTITVYDKEEENYAFVKARQEILAEFVQKLKIVAKNDSLLRLSAMDSTQLTEFLYATADEQISLEIATEQEQAKMQRRQASRSGSMTGGADINFNALGGADGGRWYFYNPSASGRGMTDFKATWGNRANEDNWRLARKSAKGKDVDESKVEEMMQEEIVLTKEERVAQRLEDLIATVPSSESEVAQLKKEVEDATHRLGNIYHFNLFEPENAISSFEKVISEYPKSEHRNEAAYLLYIIYRRQGNAEMAAFYEKLVKSEFPNSLFAKLIDNPNYEEETDKITAEVKKEYAIAYRYYKAEDFEAAMKEVKRIQREYPENDYSDNLRLLEIMLVGHMESRFNYQFALQEFEKEYPESDVLSYAKLLRSGIESLEEKKKSNIQFVEYLDQKHYAVLLYKTEDKSYRNLVSDIDDFNAQAYQKKRLKSGRLTFDEQYTVVIIDDFATKEEAIAYHRLLNSESSPLNNYKRENFYSFVISNDNWQIFYRSKLIPPYTKFFNKHYIDKYASN
ncbi:MAG: hypothetical protein JJU23_02310 [Cyclobacteriaceae bacterium]|nr:hypothetical protein [Cyclobacteriaceae bacterium]